MKSKEWGYVFDLTFSGKVGFADTVAEMIKGMSIRTHIAPEAVGRACKKFKYGRFDRKWVVTGDDGARYYDFKGARIPYDPNYPMYKVFTDSLLIYCKNNDIYDSKLAREMDALWEGPYGYTGDGIDVRVHAGDVVIDAGAWIGDFSAYAAVKGATCYAFEPTPDIFDMLQKTAALNPLGAIVPVQAGLGDSEGELTFYVATDISRSEGNRFTPAAGKVPIKARITTIDDFVRERGLERVDFIKADIEGFERNMLRGAQETLRRFAPRLALCTYHLPDDPQVMERLILEANPDYTVVQLGKKLFAEVVKPNT